MQDDNAGKESGKTSEQRDLPAEGPPTEEGATVDSAKPNPRRWWVLAVMGLGVFMVFLDSAVVNTALPAISRDLGASTSTLQWVVNAYILILAGLLLVGGTTGDRFGRRRWLGIGTVVFGGAAGAASLAPNTETLIAFRAIQGLGAAFILPATLSIYYGRLSPGRALQSNRHLDRSGFGGLYCRSGTGWRSGGRHQLAGGLLDASSGSSVDLGRVTARSGVQG